jgi:hypothetical protein
MGGLKPASSLLETFKALNHPEREAAERLYSFVEGGSFDNKV